MWYSMSSSPTGHAGDMPSTSDVKVGKKNRTIKFPCRLCEGDHHSHLFPHMDKDSYILENILLPIGYRNISPNPSLFYGLVNLVPSPVSLVYQVVNLVSSSIEPVTQVVDPIPSSISHTLHPKSAPQVVDHFPSLIDHTLPPKTETKLVDPVLSSIDPTIHSKSEDVS